MTEPKFTKGPWQISGVRHSGPLKIGANTRLHFIGPDDDYLAAVFYDMQTGKGFADARLMATAPELYDELARKDPNNPVLAKARGETPANPRTNTGDR